MKTFFIVDPELETANRRWDDGPYLYESINEITSRGSATGVVYELVPRGVVTRETRFTPEPVHK